MADIFEIAGRIHSTSQEKVTTTADEILDANLGMKQNELNAEIASIGAAVQGLSPEQTGALSVAEKANSNEAKIGYYLCDTAASTAGKTVSSTTYTLGLGGSVKIKFEHANTATSGVTLKIGSAEAKPLYYEGAAVSANNTWEDNETVEVYYNGTNYYANNVAGGSGDGVFDLTAKTGNTYATLADALTAANTIISGNKKKGGMSIKFVLTSDNKYVQCRLMTNEWSIDTDDWAIADENVYIDNPEFVYVKTDAKSKILWAIKTDGGIYYGAGVPQQIIDYIEEKIADLSLDEYEDIVAFLNNLEKEDKTLRTLLNEKIDKEDGKSLIDSEYASSKSTIDNPEFLEVTTDSKNKVLEGIQRDGTKVIGGDIKVLGNMEVSGVLYNVIENSEYLVAWVDAEDRVIFGFKTDGKTYVGDADFLTEIKNNKEAISEINSTIASIINSLDIDVLSSITAVENPEFIEVKTDSKGKILAGRTSDGAAFENVGLSTPTLVVNGVDITDNIDAIDSNTVIEDQEERSEIITDSENKIVSYRDKDGVKHENVGFNCPSLNTTSINGDFLKISSIEFKTNEEKYNFAKYLDTLKYERPKDYDLPPNGTVNIISETFYLTSNPLYSDKSGIWPIQVYENTPENASLLRVCVVYYVKSSLRRIDDSHYERYQDGVEGHDIALDFYAATQVTKIDNKYYVTSSLVDDQPVAESIEVTQIVDTPNILAWSIDKETEHNCIVNIDFGDYLSGNFYVGFKFQGASTIYNPKRNLRATFYKSNKYKEGKKLKVKIGEMPRLSGFNLKAFYTDSSRLREPFLNRIFMAIWETKQKTFLDYPWNEGIDRYSGATGMIKSFPVKVDLNNSFYGIMSFSLKKDEKNYLLDGDDDSSGIFVNGDAGPHSFDAYGWSDELGVEGRTLAYPVRGDDSVSVETAAAINSFFRYLVGEYEGTDGNTYGPGDVQKVNDIYYVRDTLTLNQDGTYSVNANSIATEHIVNFDVDTAQTHLSIIDWLDYLIGIESFYLLDNMIHNMVLYTGSDKEKFYPFFYDLDHSMNITSSDIEKDVMSAWNDSNTIKTDRLWSVFYNNYRDILASRYRELRAKILNKEYFTAVLDLMYKNIPQEWFNLEQAKWGTGNSKLYNAVTTICSRLEYFDDNIFSINN